METRENQGVCAEKETFGRDGGKEAAAVQSGGCVLSSKWESSINSYENRS